MAATSLGEVPLPLKRGMGAMSPEVSGLEVAVAEAFAPFSRVPFSQAIMTVDISTREARMRPRSKMVIVFGSAKSITARSPVDRDRR